MANLVSTTCTTLSSTVVTSPLTYITVGGSQKEFSGSISLANGATSDIITNESGYVRMVGTVHFLGVMNSMAWMFGIFDFECSRYGVVSSTILISDWGSFATSHYQNPSNVDINSLRFQNTSGSTGTFYFTALTTNFASPSSSVLTRIK